MRKLLIAVAVLAVVIPLAATFAVRALLSPDSIKRAVESQGSAWLGRPVTVASAKAQVFPRIGLELTGLRVEGPGTLSADEVRVGASLRALLSRRVEEASIHVKNGRITLGNGTAAAPPAPAPAPAATSPATSDSGFTIASVNAITFDNVLIVGGGRTLRLDLDGALNGDQFTIRSLQAHSGTTSFTARGSVTSVKQRDATLDVTSPLVDVSEVMDLMNGLVPQEAAPAGSAPGSAPARPGFGHVVINATIDKGTALGYEITKVATKLDLQGTTVTADPLNFDLYGGHYQSALTLDLAGGKVAMAHTATLAGSDLARLASLLGHPGVATGSLGFGAKLHGAGADFAHATSGVAGAADVRLTKGTITGLNVVRQVFTVLGTPAPATGQGEKFDSLTGHVTLDGGTMSADNVVLHSPDFDLTGAVHVDPRGALSGRARVTLSDAMTKQAQGTNKDLKLLFENGRITLPATIAGTLAAPSVVPDVGDLLSRAARNEVNKEVNKAKLRATDQLQKSLGGLFKKP